MVIFSPARKILCYNFKYGFRPYYFQYTFQKHSTYVTVNLKFIVK